MKTTHENMENQTQEQTQVQVVQPPITKSLTINIWAALGILGSAILSSIVITAFTMARSLNSDHFLLQSTAEAVSEIKTNQDKYVSKDVYEANQAALNTALLDIKTQNNKLDGRISDLINKID